MTRSKAKGGVTAAHPVSFVDAHGGALAALAAGIARASGRPEALAATTAVAVAVPPEIGAVLAEIGASAPPVVLASALPGSAERVDVGGWGLALHDGGDLLMPPGPAGHEGEGTLERLALARIARDRIERRLSVEPRA